MIRLAKKEELDKIRGIYAAARRFMRANGNLTQWAGGYPDDATVLDDIDRGQLYVIEEDTVWACFALIHGGEPTYREIEGAWADESPYGTIHRVAGNGMGRGVVAKCMAFARQRYDHLRIDTHADNFPMQRALEKDGFEYRGIIHLENGDPRMAYEWSKG